MCVIILLLLKSCRSASTCNRFRKISFLTPDSKNALTDFIRRIFVRTQGEAQAHSMISSCLYNSQVSRRTRLPLVKRNAHPLVLTAKSKFSQELLGRPYLMREFRVLAVGSRREGCSPCCFRKFWTNTMSNVVFSVKLGCRLLRMDALTCISPPEHF